MQENYKYPVDTVLVSADLSFLGHRNANESIHQGPRQYLSLLMKALGEEVDDEPQAGVATWQHASHDHDGVAGEIDAEVLVQARSASRRHLVLTPEQQTGRILGTFSPGPAGRLHFTMSTLDLSAFPDGGKVEIKVTVGSSGATGSFELMSRSKTHANALEPIARSNDLEPNASGTIEYFFDEGQVFTLGVRGNAGSGEPTSAFLAEVKIRQTSEE